MVRSWVALFGAVAVLALVLSACRDEEPACYDGEYAACPCAGETEGFAICRGGLYPACDCANGIPGLDGSVALPTDAGAADAGDEGSIEPALLSFGASCDANEECASSLCFAYAKGSRCTRACAVDGDCPPESGKCGGMGVCKVNL